MAKSKSKKSVKKAPKKILYKVARDKQEKAIVKKMSKILDKEEKMQEFVDKLTKRNLKRAGIKEPEVKPVAPVAPVAPKPVEPKPVKPSKYVWKDEPIDGEEEEEYIDWDYDYKPPSEPWQDDVPLPSFERLRAAQQRQPARRGRGGRSTGGRLTGGRRTGGALVSIPINKEIYVYQSDKVKRGLENSIINGVYDEINQPATTGMLKNSYNNINWNGDMLGEGIKYKNSNVSSVITNQKMQDADLENEQDYMKRKAMKRYKIEGDLAKMQEKDEDINEVLRNMAYLAPDASGNIEKKASAPKHKPVVFDYRGDNYVKLITRPYVKEQQKEIQDINNYHNDRMNEEYIQDKRYMPIYENKKDKALQENKAREDHYMRYAHDDENKIFNILKSNSMKASIYTGLRNDVPTHNEAVQNSMKASYASMTDAARKLAHNPNYFTHNTNGLHGIITPYQSFAPTKQDLVLRSQAQALARPIYT